MAATVSAPSGASWLPHDDAFNLDGWTRATEPAASPKHAHANARLHQRAQAEGHEWIEVTHQHDRHLLSG